MFLLTSLNAALNALTYPPTIAHELTHAVAARPWAERVSVSSAPREGVAVCDVVWARDAPRWAVAIAATAPTILGSALALSLLVWIAVGGGALPGQGQNLAVWLAVGAYWLVYWAPSTADLRHAMFDPQEAHNETH